MKKILFLILLGTLLVLPLVAGPIRVSFQDITVLRGSTVYIPVNIDSSLTSLNVKSYELDISYTSGALYIDSVITVGTMTQSWTSPAFHLSSGRITIASAGTEPLAGTGVLVFLKVFLPLTSSSYYGYLTFNKAYFNEGTPTTTVRNGTITIQNIPIITVSPNIGLLTVGETLQFYISGGSSPYSWYTTDPSVAIMNSSGLMTGIHAGFCQVIAIDNNGTRDTTSIIEVRAFKLIVRDTSYLQGQTFLLPVSITDLSLVNVYSGTFTVSYNSNVLTALGTIQDGTLLSAFTSPVIHLASGSITIAFSGDTSHLHATGTQVLIFIRFKITDVNTYGTTLQFSNIMFNETVAANYRNGNFNVIPRAILTVSPNTATLVAGDSLQFNVSGGATPPVIWSVGDPTLATISNSGLLKALKSGIIKVSVLDAVGATGTSGNITLYDMRSQLLNVGGKVGDTVEVPLQVGSYSPGIFSTQFTINFNQNYFTPLTVVTTGTLFEGRMTAIGSPASGSVNITAAGTNSTTGPGILLKVKFKILGTAPLGTYPLYLINTLFNEGKPFALTSNGNIIVGTTGIEEDDVYNPIEYSLDQNYPNPFNPATEIRFNLPTAAHVSLNIYNIYGEEIVSLLDGYQNAGLKIIEFNANNLSSGIYYYRMTTKYFTETKKMVFLK